MSLLAELASYSTSPAADKPGRLLEAARTVTDRRMRWSYMRYNSYELGFGYMHYHVPANVWSDAKACAHVIRRAAAKDAGLMSSTPEEEYYLIRSGQ